jgi:hypothetical protein
MLAANTYPKEYTNDCRARIEAQLAAYKSLKLTSSASSFESLFFNNLVLVLDRFFVHRTRAREGKDGNPLNEVLMLCDSILDNKGIMTANKTIKYDPAKSVLKI